MTLKQLRKRIDALDLQLLQLLNKRAALSLEVGEIKKKSGLPVFDGARERLMLKRLLEKNKGIVSDATLRKIFLEILRQSRQLQKAKINGKHA
jgi:chorismate mutase-like protein